MMINDQMRGELGYDPSDQRSFPYRQDDPPFGPHRLRLEEDLSVYAEIDPIETIHSMLGYDDDGPSNYRMLDMALRLFHKLTSDPAFRDIAYPDLFAACCRQASIWECG